MFNIFKMLEAFVTYYLLPVWLDLEIWGNFTTLAKIYKSLANFERLFNIWQNCEPTFLRHIMLLGKSSMLYLKGQK